MRPINRHPRRGAPSRFLLLGTTAIVLGAIATVGTLLALGVLHFGGPRHVYHAGRIPVPCCLHTIPAYTLVTPGYVTTPDTGDRWMEPGKIPKTVITDRRQIFFRVASRQKEMGYLFSEEDFTPKGTRPGVAAGVPEGKRAITLQADKLDGVYGLALGDHVDLVASIPVDKLSSFGGADWSRLPASAQTQAQVVPRDDKTKEKRTETRMLARDAVLVTPVTTRLKSITSSSLTQGTTVRQVPVHEIVLAVDEDEVAPLTDAMGLAVAITCVAHSGRPEDKNRNAVPPGMVAVPVNGRAVAAYNLLMPEDLLDPGTRAQKYVTLAADEVRQRGIVVDSKTVVGRVLARDKSRGQFFSEDDFLPPGTAPGLAGGIPPDKRALTLDASKVNGARALRLGDHFDLMASMPIDLTRTGGQGGSIQLMGASLAEAGGGKGPGPGRRGGNAGGLAHDGCHRSGQRRQQADRPGNGGRRGGRGGAARGRGAGLGIGAGRRGPQRQSAGLQQERGHAGRQPAGPGAGRRIDCRPQAADARLPGRGGRAGGDGPRPADPRVGAARRRQGRRGGIAG